MSRETKRQSRRTFLTAVPAAVAGAVAAKTYAQGGQAPAGPVKPATIEAAETIMGLDFHADEEAALAAGVNNRLRVFQQLRQATVPFDTEVAVVFKPALPGKEPKTGPATPHAPIRYAKPAMTLTRPANLEDAAFWPVTKLAALIERRLVSSTELTQMYLARLKRYQPTLNFYVTLTEDLALQQAAQADREIKAGKYRGPLHGIPWGAKDLYATKGIKTTYGGEPFVDQVIDYDATIVERLREAGAVLVAKLTLGALAQGDRWFGGQTKNPWNPQQGSSGSSAGPGSATAAGCVAFAIGTETRGSIISPSTVNGIVGLRPTYGRVSRYGAMPLANTMDKPGPMCRYVEDTVLVLNAIYGPDQHDPTVADVAFKWNPELPMAGLRLGYVRTAFEGAPAGAAAGGGRGGATPEQQAQQRQIYQDVLAVYQKLGAKLVPVDLPDSTLTNQLSFILDVEAAASFDELTRSGEADALQTGVSRSTWPNTFKVARFVPAVEYLRAQRARTILMQQFGQFMSQFDVLLSTGGDATLSTTNLTGQPAMTVKCGLLNNQMRIFMITGQLYDEATMARVGLAYEQATDWKDKHPTLKA
jgi:Asp-tRNA(Asn)/Glu-tRNA(Gln) amidotransferase A subunit family amidase